MFLVCVCKHCIKSLLSWVVAPRAISPAPGRAPAPVWPALSAGAWWCGGAGARGRRAGRGRTCAPWTGPPPGPPPCLREGRGRGSAGRTWYDWDSPAGAADSGSCGSSCYSSPAPAVLFLSPATPGPAAWSCSPAAARSSSRSWCYSSCRCSPRRDCPCRTCSCSWRYCCCCCCSAWRAVTWWCPASSPCRTGCGRARRTCERLARHSFRCGRLLWHWGCRCVCTACTASTRASGAAHTRQWQRRRRNLHLGGGEGGHKERVIIL